MIINLPWPDKRLNPNARIHWAVKARAVKAYRDACRVLAIQSGACKLSSDGKLPVRVTFHPPDKRRRDRDNMIGSFKAGADGVADAIGVDDADWLVTYDVGEPRPGGVITVEIDHE